ncbi:NOD26-like membrane intrinsic protein2 [Zea mays]|uniref:NOD26-like membrane intrinsic protein2 n=1 Tax=Zea mays TaxID=4577 RepID=A0A1D6NRP9_MAIZE|nr:NOD26-like membrane intrinsic protein2 [Zea mays]
MPGGRPDSTDVAPPVHRSIVPIPSRHVTNAERHALRSLGLHLHPLRGGPRSRQARHPEALLLQAPTHAEPVRPRRRRVRHRLTPARPPARRDRVLLCVLPRSVQDLRWERAIASCARACVLVGT